jgi:hypothetical protein
MLYYRNDRLLRGQIVQPGGVKAQRGTDSARAPITLLGLGLFAKSGKLLVCCPEWFWRRGNVEVVCARYQIPAVARFQDLVDFATSKTQMKLREEIREVELAPPSHRQNQ